jgi:hypothetical protein
MENCGDRVKYEVLKPARVVASNPGKSPPYNALTRTATTRAK